MSSKKLMIVDCDCGVDDALALLLALAHREKWRLLAITCCFGNTVIDNVCDNVRKILQFCEATETRVYRGCDGPLIRNSSFDVSNPFHGGDGFGDVGHEYPHDQIQMEDNHAVNALVKLAREHRQDGVHLVALGPLTNIAMAHRMDPEFTANLSSLYFMGGNFRGEGNITSAAEFNFLCDPEAANIVLTESKCPITMVPWETTVEHGMSWEFYNDWGSTQTKSAKFVKTLTKAAADMCLEAYDSFVACDILAMAAAVNPECIKTVQKHPVSVETTGRITRGQAVIERIIPSGSQACHLDIVTEFKEYELNDQLKKIVL